MKHITRWILACCILTGIIFMFLYLQPTEPVLGINGSIQKIIVQRMLDGVTSNVTIYDSGWINHTVDFDTKEAVCVTLYAQGGSADWTYQLSSNYGYDRSHTGAVTLYTFCPWPREGTYTPVIDQHSPGTFTLNPVYPDLVATQPSPDNGASFPPFCEGQTINWYTTITNNSRAKVGGTYVAYFIVTNPNDYFYPFAEVGVGGLDPYEFQVVYASHTFQATDTGTRYLNVEADPGDGEAEADETNNRQSYGPFQVIGFPTNPTLSTPANQSHLCTTRPTFQWASISGANNYHIQVDNNVTFSSPEIDITTTGTAYTLYSDLAPDDYVWRVQASNNCGNGAWSPVWELTLLTTPSAPTLQSPASGSHHCDAPALSWTTITGATSYRLQVDNSESFSSPEIDITTSYNSYSPGFGLGEGTYYWRVLANNACGAGVWSTSRRFIIEGSPPTPVLLSPQDNTIKCDTTPTLDWYSVSEADTYYIEVADNIGFNAPMIAENTTSSSYTPLSPLNPGLYYWRVYAANGCGQSTWSASRRVNILTTPTAPGLIMPLNHSQSSTTLPVFTWQAANLGETYILEVDDSPAFTSPAIDHTTAGTTYTPEHPLSEDVTYTWHVQAHNYCGNSPWSTAWQFAIPLSHTPPATLTLKAPANASHLCTHTPPLEWHPNPNATYYQVQIDMDAAFAETLISHTTTLTAYTPTPLTTTAPYYWRARAGNDCGTGPWSHVYSFTLHTLPATPELSHPQANSLITTTQLPVFEWHSVNDVINYQLGVRRPGTATPVISITTPLTTYTPGTAITPTGYTWQVRATNRCGTGPWSGVWEFTLLPQPVSPTLLSPVNTQRISDTTRPTFGWTPVDWATSYQIQVDGAPAFTTPVLSQTIPLTYHTALTGLTPGEYYWRARAANDGSNSPWSEIWRFTIQPELDSPVLQTPADKSFIATSPPLQFSWLPVNYATAYQLRIGNGPSFLTWVLSYTTPLTSYTPPQPLVPGTYYWQVQANNTGGTGEWSPVWEFTINAPPGPGIPLPLAPPDKSITTTTRPAFIWTPADYATAYQLRISDNPGFSATGITHTTSLTSYTPPQPLVPGTYYWQVQANNTGGTGEWSPVWEFTINAPPEPGIPLPLAPPDKSITTTTRPAFIWTPADYATAYQLRISDNPGFSATGISHTTSLTSYTPPHALDPGIYYWQLRATNAVSTSQWTPTQQFTLLPPPPTIPPLTAPPYRAVITDTRPTFAWQAALYSNEYQLQVSTDAGFATTNLSCTTSLTSHTFITPLDEGTYYWRARATNMSGKSPWSAIWRFTIQLYPSIPKPIFPTGGQLIQDATPTFYWESATYAQTYELQVASRPLFETLEIKADTPQTIYTPTHALSPGDHYWRVRGINAANQGAWSAIQHFTLISETLTIYNVKVTNIKDTSAVVSWLTDQEATGAVHYGTTKTLEYSDYDNRGEDFKTRLHYVTLDNLTPNNTYILEVLSNWTSDNNNGDYYPFTTTHSLPAPTPDTAYGQVFEADKVTPAAGAVVYITLMDGDHQGSPGEAATQSVLVDANGYWYTNLGESWTQDQGQYFVYSQAGDYIRLYAYNSLDETAEAIVDTANDTPALPLYIGADNEDTGGPLIRVQNYSDTVAYNQAFTITANINDITTGNHGVSQARLGYGYHTPYNHNMIPGAGPGNNGDGLWEFSLPAQGISHISDTLRFYIQAWDNTTIPNTSTEDNKGQYYTLRISQPQSGSAIRYVYLPLLLYETTAKTTRLLSRAR